MRSMCSWLYRKRNKKKDESFKTRCDFSFALNRNQTNCLSIKKKSHIETKTKRNDVLVRWPKSNFGKRIFLSLFNRRVYSKHSKIKSHTPQLRCIFRTFFHFLENKTKIHEWKFTPNGWQFVVSRWQLQHFDETEEIKSKRMKQKNKRRFHYRDQSFLIKMNENKIV